MCKEDQDYYPTGKPTLTETGHTPGPWRLRELTNNTLAVYGQGEYDIVFPRNGVEVDANAALIVAAPELPELLEVLKLTSPYLAKMVADNIETAVRPQVMLDKIRAAIAKAECQLCLTLLPG